MTTVPGMATSMSEEQQAVFYAQLGSLEKDEVAGVLLALFLGTFGAHHFYMRQKGLGVTYLLFFWTGIPALLGLIECFFMPSRVQRYNYNQAAMLAAGIRGLSPQTIAQPLFLEQSAARHCSACGAIMSPGVRFCGRCGAALA